MQKLRSCPGNHYGAPKLEYICFFKLVPYLNVQVCSFFAWNRVLGSLDEFLKVWLVPYVPYRIESTKSTTKSVKMSVICENSVCSHHIGTAFLSYFRSLGTNCTPNLCVLPDFDLKWSRYIIICPIFSINQSKKVQILL